MFNVSLTIGTLRTQSDLLGHIQGNRRQGDRRKNNMGYHAKEMRDIESGLRKIRKADFESMYKCM